MSVIGLSGYSAARAPEEQKSDATMKRQHTLMVKLFI